MSAEYTEHRRLTFRPEDLYQLVSDVRRYPDFIGLITGMRVTHEDLNDEGGVLEAKARVKYKFVREQFTTRVHLDATCNAIDVEYLSGPFHTLANRWRFHELSDGSTLVDFWIRYAFRNPVLQMLVDTNRGRAVSYLIRAFETEAKKRYEPVGSDDLDLKSEMMSLQLG